MLAWLTAPVLALGYSCLLYALARAWRRLAADFSVDASSTNFQHKLVPMSSAKSGGHRVFHNVPQSFLSPTIAHEGRNASVPGQYTKAKHAWVNHQSREVETDIKDLPIITVLVPARNEAGQLADCLHGLLAQDYPTDRYEIIVIDDHSEDDTLAIAQALSGPRLRVLRLADHLAGRPSTAYKKEALQYGIAEARGELLLTTDADCQAPPTWLRTMAAAYEEGYEFLCAPVRIADRADLLTTFQALDVAGVMLLTGGSAALRQPLLCNGANLGFSRRLFEAVGGYEGLRHRASGDDVLLLQKIKARFPEAICFLASPHAIITTQPTTTWPALWQQRLRWAAKTSVYRDWRLVAFQGGVFLLCWVILLSLLVGACYSTSLFLGGLLALAIKAAADYGYLRYAAHWFGRPAWMRYFFPSEIIHTLYVAVVGLIALLPVHVRWKGRKTR